MRRTFVLASLMLASVVAFGCGGGGHDEMMTGPSGTGAGMGLAAFLSMSPSGGQAGVSVSTPIVMRFGSAMASGMEQYVDLHDGDLAGPVVPMSCAWSGDRTSLTCTPSEPLRSRTTYWIHLGGGLMTQAGQPIDYDAYGPGMGGQWIQGGMMGGSHAGTAWGMMGGPWHGANGAYGMAFPFTTA
jgi:Bacterial Ig-like domain